MLLNIFSNTENTISEKFLLDIFQENMKELSSISEHTAATKNKELEINLILVGNEEIQELNKQWRDKNKITDVLSFPYEETQAGIFGEIFICIPRCQEQADNLGHSLEKEISVLLTHGILHLFGYDHIEDSDFKTMNSLEKSIEKRLQEEKIV